MMFFVLFMIIFEPGQVNCPLLKSPRLINLKRYPKGTFNQADKIIAV